MTTEHNVLILSIDCRAGYCTYWQDCEKEEMDWVFLFVCFLFDYDFLLQLYLNSGVQKEVLWDCHPNLVNSKAPGSCLGLFLWMYEWMCRQEMQRSSCLWKNKQHWSSIWSTNHPTHFLFISTQSLMFFFLWSTHSICIIQSCLHLFECLWVAERDRQGWCHCYLNMCDSLLCTMDFCQSGHPGTKWPWIVVF